MPIPKEVNPDLVKERKNASFDVDELSAWFYGGRMNVDMRHMITDELYAGLGDPMEFEYLSYEDVNSLAVKNAVDAITKMKKMQERIHPGGSEIYPTLCGGPVGGALMPAGNPFAVHIVMFTRALNGQATEEQYEKWGKRADACQIIGTYAQTELGHGTYLRGLETRADYDRNTDEFILNTPYITSYKWWPGGLGHVANYCIVVAQLYIDNESKGVQLFLMQVRDEETHAVLPGIDIGEIGKKIGMPGVNNGYLGLKNVRIPRDQMLMKNAKVLPGGEFIKSPVSQLSYFPMVYVRCMVALANSLLLLQAVTIATRYSAVRRQSPINPDEPEPQVLEHVTQQMKVFPEIATGLAYKLAAAYLWKMYTETYDDINKSDYSRLPELHALACTLKASTSYDSTYGVERLRQSCGGHGYLAAANFGNIFSLANAACTYEGENSVLYMQVGKILLKTWDQILAGNKLMPTMAYLSECADMKSFPKWTGTWENMVKALEYITTSKTRIAYNSYSARLKQGQTEPVAVNNTAIELTQAAELHGRSFVTNTFLQEVVGVPNYKRSPQFQKVLENLLELYLIVSVQRHMSDILRFITLTQDELTALQTRLEVVLQKLRPDVVAIVDGFAFHDREIGSVLGCYDGNVYERIMDSAKRTPMNKKIIPDHFEKYLKPFMKSNM